MIRGVVKFALIGLGIVAVGITALFIIDWVRYQRSPEYRALQELEELKRQVAEDPYGGDTPEDTLRLFVDALKKGDTDRAAKYFVMDKQEEWSKELAGIKDKGLLDEMVRDLGREKEKKVRNDNVTVFYIYNDMNVLALGITLSRGPNVKWKIQDL